MGERDRNGDPFEQKHKVVYRKKGQRALNARKRKRLFKIDIRKSREAGLNLQEEMFCRYYTSDTEFYGDGFNSCAAAFGFDIYDKREAASCKYKAAGLLRTQKILNRINELLQTVTLNNVHVDKQLGFLITQNSDFKSKLGAIKEYNKLNERVSERIKVDGPAPVTKIEIVSMRDLFGDDPDIFGE